MSTFSLWRINGQEDWDMDNLWYNMFAHLKETKGNTNGTSSNQIVFEEIGNTHLATLQCVCVCVCCLLYTSDAADE